MKSYLKIYIWVLLILIVCSSSVSANSSKAKTLDVINGYSIKVLTDDGVKVVRLAEIIAPSAVLTTFSTDNEAKEFLQKITSGQELTLVFWALDVVGRSVCKVFLPDGTSIGSLMVSEGYALQDRNYSSNNELNRLEQTARKKKSGVWKYLN